MIVCWHPSRSYKQLLVSTLSQEVLEVASVADLDRHQPELVLAHVDHAVEAIRFQVLVLVPDGMTSRQMRKLVDCVGQGASFVLESRVQDAIDTVLAGDDYYERSVVKQLLAELAVLSREHRWRHRLDETPLSRRETEILPLLVWSTNKQIADRLGISVSTVKHHVHHILRKLGVSTRREAVEHALSHQWISID